MGWVLLTSHREAGSRRAWHSPVITRAFIKLRQQVKPAGMEDHFLCCLHITGSPGTTYWGYKCIRRPAEAAGMAVCLGRRGLIEF